MLVQEAIEYMGTLITVQHRRQQPQGGGSVHEKDADHVSLEQRLAIVLAV